MEVLRQLTLRQQEPTGPTLEQFEELRHTAQENSRCISDLTTQLVHMSEGMAQMESMQRLSHNALTELWKAVKAIQVPPDGKNSLPTLAKAVSVRKSLHDVL